MATLGWRNGRSLKDQLVDEGSGFNYFQLLRLLDRARETGDEQIDDPDFSDWKVWADLDAAFPANDIRNLQVSKDKSGKDKRLVARTSNYCVAGHSGPLPETFSDWIREQQRYGYNAMSAFLDIFNHRINLLRYQSKKCSQVSMDDRKPEEGILAPGLTAAMGMHDERLFAQLPLSKRSILAMSGLLAGRRMNARSMQRVISKCFGLPARVIDLVGAWRKIASDQICQLGHEGVSVLGEMCLLGQEHLDMNARIRIELGPVDIHTYLALLPEFEFSSRGLILEVRSPEDIDTNKISATAKQGAYFAEEDTEDSRDNTQPESSGSRVENIRLRFNPKLSREQVFVPTRLEVDKNSSSNPLIATAFIGYLFRPFAALARYLCNASAHIEVFLQVDSDTLLESGYLSSEGYPELVYPSVSQKDSEAGHFLRLGQSFWVGKPEDIEKLERRKTALERIFRRWDEIREVYLDDRSNLKRRNAALDALGTRKRQLQQQREELELRLDIARNARASYLISADDSSGVMAI